MAISKEVRNEIFVGVIILCATIITQIAGFYIVRSYQKSDVLKEHRVELMDRLALDMQLYLYQSQFRATSELLQVEHLRSKNPLPSPVTIKLGFFEQIRLQDTLREMNPLVYNKSLESDIQAAKLFGTLSSIELLFADESVANKCGEIRKIIPFFRYFKTKMDERNQSNTSPLTEQELEVYFITYQNVMAEKMNETLNAMYTSVND